MGARHDAGGVENEVRMFWRVTKDIRDACARGESIVDDLDELDLLRDMTENATLKACCSSIISKYAIRTNARRRRA